MGRKVIPSRVTGLIANGALDICRSTVSHVGAAVFTMSKSVTYCLLDFASFMHIHPIHTSTNAMWRSREFIQSTSQESVCR